MTSERAPDDSTRLSRRHLLAGLTGVGAVGMAGGAGTFAYLTDGESLVDNALGAGEVAFDVSCGDGNTGECAVSNGAVSFAIDGIDRGSHGAETFGIAVRTNPARLWLATTCPPVPDPFGEALETSLAIDEAIVYAGSLAGLRREFVNGLRLDDLDGEACLSPEDSVDVALSWSLPEDASGSLAGASTAAEFRLYTEQCRHVSEDAVAGSNPFANFAPCEEPPACAVCEGGNRFRDLTFEYLGDADATIRATTTRPGPEDDAVVFDAATVASGGTFTVDGSDVSQRWNVDTSLGPDTTLSILDGGDGGASSAVTIHTSCSEPLFVGDTFGSDGSGTPLYELVAGTVTDGSPLCGPEELS